MAATDWSRKRRRPRVRALVLSCVRLDGHKGDLWTGRHFVVCALTCGHTIRKLLDRRLLMGEKIICPECTNRRYDQPTLPGFYSEATV